MIKLSAGDKPAVSEDGSRSTVPSEEPAPDARLPKGAAMKTGATNPQFEFTNEVTMQLATEEAVVQKRQEALSVWRWIGMAAGVVLLIGLLNEGGSFLINRVPPAGELAERSRKIASQVLGLYATSAQPLTLESVKEVLINQEFARRVSYDVVVALQLRADLFALADTNGAQPYLLLQRKLDEAQDKVLRYSLNLAMPALEHVPELPHLLMQTHRTGEKLLVTVPLEAERSGWSWKYVPVELAQRRVNRVLKGEVLAHFTSTPVLIFNSDEDRAARLLKMQEARDYVLAVNNVMLRHGLEK